MDMLYSYININPIDYRTDKKNEGKMYLKVNGKFATLA